LTEFRDTITHEAGSEGTIDNIGQRAMCNYLIGVNANEVSGSSLALLLFILGQSDGECHLIVIPGFPHRSPRTKMKRIPTVILSQSARVIRSNQTCFHGSTLESMRFSQYVPHHHRPGPEFKSLCQLQVDRLR